MIKYVAFYCTFFVTAFFAGAQNFQWAKRMGGANSESGLSVKADESGNVYNTGFFSGTADFDPGASTFNLTSSGGKDIFISKLDPTGNFVWAKIVGGGGDDEGFSLALDGSANIYLTGYFNVTSMYGSIDFDPGPGVYNLSGVINDDLFVLKLDASGNFVWATRIGGSAYERGQAIAVDASGNSFVSGYTAGGSILVAKLDASGNVSWTKNMTGASGGYRLPKSIAVDGSGGIYTTGCFYGTTDFDPGTDTYNLSSSTSFYRDIFISKLDANGNFVWAKRIGGEEEDEPFSLALDASGNIYSTGYFNLEVDFDPGIGTFPMVAAGPNVYVSKWDKDGNFVWARNMGGNYLEEGSAIAVDPSGSCFVAGVLSGYGDFDPGAGSTILASTSMFTQDIFVLKLDAGGNLSWAKSFGGADDDLVKSLVVDGSGNVYLTGSFQGTADFDPAVGNFTMTSVGVEDIYISKLTVNNTLGCWNTKASMPAAKAWFTSATVNGIIYVFGGNQSNTVYAYNPATNSWTTKAPMPATRWGCTSGVINGLIYLAGGWGGGSCCPNNNLWVYNPVTDSWSSRANMPTLSAGGTAAVINGKFYVTTFYNGFSGFRNFLHAYDPATNSWSALANSPSVHFSPAGGAIDGKFYVAGGNDPNNNNLNSSGLEVYDPVTNSWTTKAPLPTPRGGLCGGVVNGKLIAMGGANASRVNTVEAYDPVTNSWSTWAAMSGSRDGLSAAVLNDMIFVTGGTNPTDEISTLEVFSPPFTAGITSDGPTTFCLGDSVQLTAGSATSWLWSNNSTTQTITVKEPGNYSVTAYSASGCSSTSSPLSVVVNPVPLALLSSSRTPEFCEGDSTILSAEPGFTYLWNNNATTQSITVKQTGEYSVTVTNSQGCSNQSAPENVTVFPRPVATIAADRSTVFCEGDSVVLSAGSASSYLWSNNAITPSITVKSTGLYSVTITNARGCSNTSAGAPVQVNPLPPPCNISVTPSSSVYTGGDPNKIYLGYGPQSVTLTPTVAGSETLTYSWNGPYLSGNGNSRLFTPLTAGNFTLVCTITNTNGCKKSCQVSICVLDIRANNSNVYVCRQTGNQNNYVTVSLNVNAVAARLTGINPDRLGRCGQNCSLGKTYEETQYGMNDEGDHLILVYPNPSRDIFNLQVLHPTTEDIFIQVMDVTGREVENKNYQPTDKIIRLDLSELGEGIYTAIITRGELQQAFKLFKENRYVLFK